MTKVLNRQDKNPVFVSVFEIISPKGYGETVLVPCIHCNKKLYLYFKENYSAAQPTDVRCPHCLSDIIIWVHP